MALRGIFGNAARTLPGAPAARRCLPFAARAAAAGAAVLGLALAGAAIPGASVAHAATQPTIFGTLDTQTGTAAKEKSAGVTMAMFELNWASFEPQNGVVSSSYLATMKSYLAAYQAAGQKVTLGLGLQNPPS